MKLEVRSHEIRSKKSEVMKLEVRSHEVRSSNELPGLSCNSQYHFCIIL